MRLAAIRIENFRSFMDETIPLDSYTCFVGPNGAGKSTVLVALNLFFRNTSSSPTDLINLTEEDFHLKDISRPVRITLMFDRLSAEAKEALKAYVRQDQLVISAVAAFDPASRRAPVVQKGARLVMKEFKEYFAAQESGARSPQLRQTYEAIRSQFPDLPSPGTLDSMRLALRSFEDAHPEKCELVEGETQFYGWSRGENLLRRFVQWVYVPAVKDPTSEQEEGRTTALGALLERTIRSKVTFEKSIEEIREKASAQYRSMLDANQGALNSLTESLTNKLHMWAHGNASVALKWHFNDQSSIKISDPLARVYAGENEFLGELGRSGHGLQRSLLVALLQELAENSEGSADTLLLGFEEPELYQHPPQARHMATILEALSDKTTQVVITTHSPYFVSGKGFPFVRMVRNDLTRKTTKVTRYTHQQLAQVLAAALKEAPRSPTATMAAVEQIMQPSQNELYFSRVAVLVEGPEDVAYISTYMQLLGLWGDFRKLGCHFVVASGKANLSRPLAIAMGLKIPAFTVFDIDNNKADDSNKRNNTCLFNLCNVEVKDGLSNEIVWAKNLVAWPVNLKRTVMGEIGEAEWERTDADVQKKYAYEGVGQKNQLVLAAILEELWDRGKKCDSLEKLCQAVLHYAAATA